MGQDKEQDPKDQVAEDLREFEGNLTEQMYRELLERAYEKIATLKMSLVKVQEQTVNLRDQVASKCYPTTLSEASSTEEAAIDAYRAADAFLRVRETGVAYDSDVIKMLRELRDNNGNTDEKFGRAVRNFINGL